VETGKTAWLSLIRSANRRTKNSRVLRRAGISTYSYVVRANRFLPPPRVLLNGPPKSGTHLLSDCLSLMPKMMFSGRHFALADFFVDSAAAPGNGSLNLGSYPELREARLTEFLRRCPQGMFVTAHARFHPLLETLIGELQFRHVLLLRDPRDVVVSHAFYVEREPLHFHHRYFTRTLKSDEDRIMATIRGFGSATSDGPPLLPIGESYAGFIRWLNDPSTLVIRFEDLIGPRGGSDVGKQLNAIKSIGDFVGRPLSQEQTLHVAQKMYGKGSLTFRKGRRGDWQNHFTEAHRRAFKEVAGDTLVELGYEKDSGW
jgi:hypothetical protein